MATVHIVGKVLVGVGGPASIAGAAARACGGRAMASTVDCATAQPLRAINKSSWSVFYYYYRVGKQSSHGTKPKAKRRIGVYIPPNSIVQG